MTYFDGFLTGLILGFGAFCLVAGVGAAFKVVQWIGKRLGVPAFL